MSHAGDFGDGKQDLPRAQASLPEGFLSRLVSKIQTFGRCDHKDVRPEKKQSR